jgi:esterase/lipase
METTLTLTTPDNHTIYGTLNSQNDTCSNLIIFVHGLTGNQNEHQYFNAVPFFTEKGFDTFRFDFYSEKENARQLSECSITVHLQDLSVIIHHFEKTYSEIFLVGHSLGGPVIIQTDLSSITKIVLWDPTEGMNSLEEKGCVYNEKLDSYMLEWGMDIIINQEMIDDWKKASNIKALIDTISKPCKFVFAGNEKKHSTWEPHIPSLTMPNESVIIDKASHGFTEEGVEQQLFDETLDWLTD